MIKKPFATRLSCGSFFIFPPDFFPLSLKIFFLLLLIFTSHAKDVYAIDARSDREKIVSAKSRKFYKSSRVKKSVLLSGDYSSDWNSKRYQFDGRYFYQSDKQIHELYLLRDIRYANKSTKVGQTQMVKKADIYDGTLSNKFVILNSKNYVVLYNRRKEDALSDYKYDIRTAAGLGRIFFGDKLEFDLSFGYNKNGSYENKSFLLPSFRLNVKLSDKASLIQRGFIFVNNSSVDTDLRTSIKYRLTKNTSLAINHSFEQRKYSDKTNKVSISESSRFTSFGLIFDLD